MNKYIKSEHALSIFMLFVISVLLIFATVGSPNETTNKEKVNPNTCGSLSVYEKGEMVYAYQGEIDIINDGTNGDDIEIVIDIDENMKP